MKAVFKSALAVLVVIFMFGGCTNQQNPVAPVNTEASTDINAPALTLEDFPLEPLSDGEIEGLIFMREEEKLARDVYDTLYIVWGQRIFSNISESEAKHTEAVKSILDRYTITDPVVDDKAGAFSNASLSALYNDLVQSGGQSLIDGLKVGAVIEEIDILDLRHQLDEVVDNQDIAFVYENLMSGSRNHLRAFVRNLERKGVDYTPQYLSEAAFEAIMTSDTENGRSW